MTRHLIGRLGTGAALLAAAFAVAACSSTHGDGYESAPNGDSNAAAASGGEGGSPTGGVVMAAATFDGAGTARMKIKVSEFDPGVGDLTQSKVEAWVGEGEAPGVGSSVPPGSPLISSGMINLENVTVELPSEGGTPVPAVTSYDTAEDQFWVFIRILVRRESGSSGFHSYAFWEEWEIVAGMPENYEDTQQYPTGPAP